MSVYSNQPWKSSYKLGPFELAQSMAPYPRVPLFAFLQDTAARHGNRPACFYLGAKMSYRELAEQVDRLATALQAMGVGHGDKVATILPTCPQFVIADNAITKCGAAHVPCSLLHKAHDLVWEIGESGAKVVICLDDALDLVKAVAEETALEQIVLTSWFDYSAKEPELPAINGAVWLRDIIAKAQLEPTPVEIDPDNDLGLLVFTGGATGLPKGVMLTHSNLVSNTIQSLPWALSPLAAGIKAKSSVLIGIPTFHSYGQWAVRAAVYWGMQMLLIPDPRDTGAIAENLKTHRPFMAPLVPTQYMRLIDEKIGRTNTTFTSGAAPLPPEVSRRFKQATGMPITEAYGLTETSPVTHFNLSSFAKITGYMPFEKLGSFGVPVADTEVKVLNEDTGQEVDQGQVGEMYLKGPQIMKGYWPEEGKGLVDGWLPTGDLCRMDEDGYFYLVDRNKDMINVSGNKVYSTKVDEVLFEHPAVAQAVTIGVPDAKMPGNERVKAFVVLTEGGPGASEEEIIAHCREHLAPYAVPKQVELRKELPQTVTGKLFKKQLRDEEIAKLGR